MIFKKFIVLFWAFLLATAAIAGEEQRTKIKIAIDDETRERIREVLQSAGQDGEVMFIDTSELTAGGAHGRHEVRVIKKEVDATN